MRQASLVLQAFVKQVQLCKHASKLLADQLLLLCLYEYVVSRAEVLPEACLPLGFGTLLLSPCGYSLFQNHATTKADLVMPSCIMLVQALQPNEGEVEELRGHVVIAGFGRVGQIIAQLLSERLIPFVALDVQSDRVQVCMPTSC